MQEPSLDVMRRRVLRACQSREPETSSRRRDRALRAAAVCRSCPVILFAGPRSNVLDVDASLATAGEGVRTVELSLDDLKTKFKSHTVTATLQCTGNRRHEINEVKPVQVWMTYGCREGRAACKPAFGCLPARIVDFTQSRHNQRSSSICGCTAESPDTHPLCCRASTGMSGRSATLHGPASGCQTC